LSIPNSRAGISAFSERLTALEEPVKIALESSGQYWLCLYDQLTAHGYDVRVLNPLQINAYRQTGIRKTKTDTVDAFWIADLLRIHSARPNQVPTALRMQLRELSRFRFNLMDRIGDLKRKVLSVGVVWLADAARLEMRCLIEQIQFLEEQIAQLDAQLEQLLAQADQYLTTIPGLGPVLAATILGEIGDVYRFPALEQLLAYVGIDPTVHENGQFGATQMHMSKRGSPYLRRAMLAPSHRARQHDPELRAYYRKKKPEGKHHNTVIGALCRKLLAHIYVILREKRPYVIR
jgi:transposase